jgi:hypothetical protein
LATAAKHASSVRIRAGFCAAQSNIVRRETSSLPQVLRKIGVQPKKRAKVTTQMPPAVQARRASHR